MKYSFYSYIDDVVSNVSLSTPLYYFMFSHEIRILSILSRRRHSSIGTGISIQTNYLVPLLDGLIF